MLVLVVQQQQCFCGPKHTNRTSFHVQIISVRATPRAVGQAGFDPL